MTKATKILFSLKPSETNFKAKVMILAHIINEPKHGHLLPDKLYKWANKVGLKTTTHFEDRTSWTTVTEK